MRAITTFILAFLLVSSSAFSQSKTAEVKIITPVTDRNGQAVFQPAMEGKQYLVVREADDSDLVRRARDVLASGIPEETLKLDRFARNLLISESTRSGAKPDPQLSAPMYLLLSQEEGGFARYGFWLESPDNKRELIMAQYVDLAIGESGIQDGTLEEIFPHELAHVILRSLFGDRFQGPSVKMHQSMSVTDYQTAFDEGYAEHLQPLVRDNTGNPHLQSLLRATTAVDLDLFWLSRVDQQLRTDGTKRNLFVHRKSIPDSAIGHADPYLIFTDSETSPDFLHDELKNGQEMMASEGVISTLFYRLVNDARLQSTYRDAAFYDSFLVTGTPADIRAAITPYENVNLKLFAAMRRVAQSSSLDRPLAAAIVDQYAKLFPDEADSIYDVFLSTTYGATASQEAAKAFEKAFQAGRRGDIERFRADSREAFATLSKVKGEVLKGSMPLDGNIGPQLWLLNSSFKIATAYWQKDRTQSLTINLNTATEAELMTIEGIDLSLARRIIAERRKRGFFKSVNELQHFEGVRPALFERLGAMAAAMRDAKSVARP
jgi:DNA uptake protein ComE-like DNA-binding protein